MYGLMDSDFDIGITAKPPLKSNKQRDVAFVDELISISLHQ